MLGELGWTEAEFEVGIQRSKWNSLGKLWRSNREAFGKIYTSESRRFSKKWQLYSSFRGVPE